MKEIKPQEVWKAYFPFIIFYEAVCYRQAVFFYLRVPEQAPLFFYPHITPSFLYRL